MTKLDPSRPSGAANPALRLAAVRKWHVYLGAFVAPSVLFFAITGGLLLFRLHEVRDAFQPPALIQKLGRLHQDQVFDVKPKRPSQPSIAVAQSKAGASRAAVEKRENGPKASAVALRWFFLLASAALVASTCLGLWMGLQYSRRKGLVWLTLAAGAVVPVALWLI